MTHHSHVFISYARSDGREYASRLYHGLMAHGFSGWLDTRNINPTQDFTAEIELAIENASHVAVCITPDSKRSDSFVRREIQYAQALRKPVIPLRFADVPPHVQLINNEWVDFFRSWDTAFDRLCDILRGESHRTLFSSSDDPFRDYLQLLYQSIVLYLKQTVFSVQPDNPQVITLQTVSTPNAVSQPASLLTPFFATAGVNDHELPPTFSNFRDAFQYYNGRILLLGEPGAGKTITLMAFARDAVAARLENPALPLPILAHIATWDAVKQPPLAEWLLLSLPLLKPESVAAIISSGQAILLLDSLDELGQDQQDTTTGDHFDPRQRFLGVIPTQNQILITCRTQDYADIGQQISLNGAVTLQPLNDTQIRAYLHDLPDLWVTLAADGALLEVTRTPLLLSLFTNAFCELPEETQKLHNLSQSDLRDRIFETYIRHRYMREVRKFRTKPPFSLEEICAVLGRIAAESISHRVWDEERSFTLETYLGTTKTYEIIRLASELNLLTLDQHGIFRFTHLLLRDYFAATYARSCLTNTASTIRANAINTLRKLNDPRHVEVFIMMLNDPHWRVRSYAAIALGESGNRRSVIPLIALLSDENLEVQNFAVIALGQLRDTRAVNPLVSTLHNPDTDISHNAARALEHIGTPEALAAVERWRRG